MSRLYISSMYKNSNICNTVNVESTWLLTHKCSDTINRVKFSQERQDYDKKGMDEHVTIFGTLKENQ